MSKPAKAAKQSSEKDIGKSNKKAKIQEDSVDLIEPIKNFLTEINVKDAAAALAKYAKSSENKVSFFSSAEKLANDLLSRLKKYVGIYFIAYI